MPPSAYNTTHREKTKQNTTTKHLPRQQENVINSIFLKIIIILEKDNFIENVYIVLSY